MTSKPQDASIDLLDFLSPKSSEPLDRRIEFLTKEVTLLRKSVAALGENLQEPDTFPRQARALDHGCAILERIHSWQDIREATAWKRIRPMRAAVLKTLEKHLASLPQAEWSGLRTLLADLRGKPTKPRETRWLIARRFLEGLEERLQERGSDAIPALALATERRIRMAWNESDPLRMDIDAQQKLLLIALLGHILMLSFWTGVAVDREPLAEEVREILPTALRHALKGMLGPLQRLQDIDGADESWETLAKRTDTALRHIPQEEGASLPRSPMAWLHPVLTEAMACMLRLQPAPGLLDPVPTTSLRETMDAILPWVGHLTRLAQQEEQDLFEIDVASRFVSTAMDLSDSGLLPQTRSSFAKLERLLEEERPSPKKLRRRAFKLSRAFDRDMDQQETPLAVSSLFGMAAS